MGYSLKNFILVSDKIWHDRLYNELKADIQGYWIRFQTKEEFNSETLAEINPEWIFIPHWSYIIPNAIYNDYKCVVFHMTDLPFGSGSPLQNLIEKGFTETKISAIRVSEGIDTGDVFLKKPLSLYGTAEEIFIRAIPIIKEMIIHIINENPVTIPQFGEPTVFKRRKPSDGNLDMLSELEQVYDYIRMLDCYGYPPAFIETDNFKFEFNRASLKGDGSILADARITRK